MAPHIYDQTIYIGESFDRAFPFTVGGQPLDLAGFTFEAGLRQKNGCEVSTVVNVSVTPPNNVVINIEREQLARLDPNQTYLFDLIASNADGDTVVLRGEWTIISGATQGRIFQ